MPAADFSADELLYLPRNVRAHKLYGMSPVEQIALTINVALRREATTLEYYRASSAPNALGAELGAVIFERRRLGPSSATLMVSAICSTGLMP